MLNTRVECGAVAPPFVLHDAAGASASPRGVPWVLAFARGWAPGRGDDGPIRAQLRGLGAVMIVVGDAGVWWFRPDDDLERFATPGPRLDGELHALAIRYGVPDDGDAVFVVDAAGVVRFARAAEALDGSLAEALDTAGRAVTRIRAGAISRRDFAVLGLVAGFGLAVLPSCRKRRDGGKVEAPAPATGELDVVLHVNGTDRALRIDPRTSLLDALRERLAMTGTKKGCDAGQCGACTVLSDGRAVNACLTLAAAAQGARITTIEGLARGDVLHPVQAAFVAHDGFQCGYCTPGQIVSAVALIAEGRARTDDEVREHMSGNLCRCGAYPNIVAAIQAARQEA